MTQLTIEDMVEKHLDESIRQNMLYHVRVDIDNDQGPTYKDVVTFLSGYHLYLCSDVEYKNDGTEHVHVLLRAECDRKHLREKVKQSLDVKLNQFSTSYVRDVKQVVKYIVKEGYSQCKGIPIDFVKKLKKLSVKKAGKKEITKFLIEQRDRYINTPTMGVTDCIADIVEFHRIHGKTWSRSTLMSQVTLWTVQKHPAQVRCYANNLAESIDNSFRAFN